MYPLLSTMICYAVYYTDTLSSKVTMTVSLTDEYLKFYW